MWQRIRWPDHCWGPAGSAGAGLWAGGGPRGRARLGRDDVRAGGRPWTRRVGRIVASGNVAMWQRIRCFVSDVAAHTLAGSLLGAGGLGWGGVMCGWPAEGP